MRRPVQLATSEASATSSFFFVRVELILCAKTMIYKWSHYARTGTLWTFEMVDPPALGMRAGRRLHALGRRWSTGVRSNKSGLTQLAARPRYRLGLYLM